MYVNYDKTTDIQDTSVYSDERESNIEYSLISDGYREPEEVKDEIHKNNYNKGEGYFGVEVNSNGEENLKETTTTSHSTKLEFSQFFDILDHFKTKEGGFDNNATIRWVQKNMNCPNFQRLQLNRIPENESRIQNADRKDKLKKLREKEGEYPNMDKSLFQWIRDTRKEVYQWRLGWLLMKGKIFCTNFNHYNLLLQMNLVTILSRSVIIDRNGSSRGTFFL